MGKPVLEPGWLKVLGGELEAPYMQQLREFLRQEKQRGATVFPPAPLVFSAFNHTPFDAVKVVIIGQDPYHGPGQSHGLAFSVQPGVAIPPSLRNMFKELSLEYADFRPPAGGNLSAWAAQGVLLLNATLTVRAHEAASHQKKGWERFTDEAIRQLSAQRSGIVFLLWGRHAQQKEALIDPQKHFILKAPHPSPLSAHHGFLGCGHFKKANDLLISQGKEPVRWGA